MSASAHDKTHPANNAAPSAAPREALQPAGVKGREIYRWVPDGYAPVALVGAPDGAEAFIAADGKSAIGYSGKRSKHDFYVRFASAERATAYLNDWVTKLVAAVAQREKNRAARRAVVQAGHGCKVGDVFECSWGYEQTNVDYYQITALHGKTLATVRRIGRQSEETGWLRGECAPAPGMFLDEQHYPPMRVRINPGQIPHFKARSYANAYRMTPTVEVGGLKTYQTAHWSAYA